MTSISAVVTVGPSGCFLAEGLASVAAQERPPDELVVVADGTPAEALGPARAAAARVVELPGVGVAAARNAGLAASRGELVALLDHDDAWAPGKLRVQEAVLLADPGLGATVGLLDAFLEPGVPRPAWLPAGWLDGPRRAAQVGTLLLRRSAWVRVGPFSPAREPADDVDWLLRARHAGLRIAETDDVVLRYRVHDANRSGDSAALRAAVLGAVRGAVRRRAREAT